MPIESLKVGDLVRTMDNGFKNILWIGTRKLSAAELEANPNLRPIRVRAGALGRGVPSRDLIASTQHRILIDSRIAKRMFGERQVLASAKSLLAIDGIEIVENGEGVEYTHFLFGQHEVVFAEGTASESLDNDRQSLKSLSVETLQEIFTILPELAEMDADSLPRAARILATTERSRHMIERHIDNQLMLVESHSSFKSGSNRDCCATAILANLESFLMLNDVRL